MRRLQVGIGAIGLVQMPVIVHPGRELRAGWVWRQHPHRSVVRTADPVVAIFIDVIAQEQHQVQVFLRQEGIGVVVPVAVILAVGQPDVQLRQRIAGSRQGLEPPGAAGHAVIDELVVVYRERRQHRVLDRQSDRVVVIGRNRRGALQHNAPRREVRCIGNLPGNGGIAGDDRRGVNPGPQHHAVHVRVAGGDALRIGAGLVACGACGIDAERFRRVGCVGGRNDRHRRGIGALTYAVDNAVADQPPHRASRRPAQKSPPFHPRPHQISPTKPTPQAPVHGRSHDRFMSVRPENRS